MTTRFETSNEGASVWKRLLQRLKAFDEALGAAPGDGELDRLNGRIAALEATVRDTSVRQG